MENNISEMHDARMRIRVLLMMLMIAMAIIALAGCAKSKGAIPMAVVAGPGAPVDMSVAIGFDVGPVTVEWGAGYDAPAEGATVLAAPTTLAVTGQLAREFWAKISAGWADTGNPATNILALSILGSDGYVLSGATTYVCCSPTTIALRALGEGR